MFLNFTVYKTRDFVMSPAPEITENKLYSEKCDVLAMGIITFKL